MKKRRRIEITTFRGRTPYCTQPPEGDLIHYPVTLVIRPRRPSTCRTRKRLIPNSVSSRSLRRASGTDQVNRMKCKENSNEPTSFKNIRRGHSQRR